MANIKAFLFDMDGVLTETSTYHFLAWKELADSLNIEMDLAFNEKLKGISRMASLDLILIHGNRIGELSPEEKTVLAERKNNRYLEMISNFNETNLFPGVRELLTNIKARDMKIAIASASFSAPLLVRLMKVQEYVDFIADPGIVPGKPAPDLFLQCARALQIDASACAGVEDAEAGIQAIRSAGMYAIGIGTKEQLDQADLLYRHSGDMNLEEILKAADRSSQR